MVSASKRDENPIVMTNDINQTRAGGKINTVSGGYLSDYFGRISVLPDYVKNTCKGIAVIRRGPWRALLHDKRGMEFWQLLLMILAILLLLFGLFFIRDLGVGMGRLFSRLGELL